MKKFLKWTGIILGALAGLIVILLVFVYFKSRERLTRIYDLPERAKQLEIAF